MRVLLLVLVLTLSAGVAGAATDWRTEPASSFTASGPGIGGGLPATASIHDAVFYSPDQLPPVGELTDAEKFMLLSSRDPAGSGRLWLNEIEMVCMAYESRGKQLPAALTPDMLAAAFECTPAEASGFAFFRNPLTGAPLRLDAKEPSAGDLYFRRMTTEEAAHVAQVDGNLSLNLGHRPFMVDGKPEYNHLLGDVYYCRAYGVGGRVIGTFALYVFAPDSPRS